MGIQVTHKFKRMCIDGSRYQVGVVCCSCLTKKKLRRGSTTGQDGGPQMRYTCGGADGTDNRSDGGMGEEKGDDGITVASQPLHGGGCLCCSVEGNLSEMEYAEYQAAVQKEQEAPGEIIASAGTDGGPPLSYVPDASGGESLVVSADGRQVMMSWEEPYMSACVDALKIMPAPPHSSLIELGKFDAVFFDDYDFGTRSEREGGAGIDADGASSRWHRFLDTLIQRGDHAAPGCRVTGYMSHPIRSLAREGCSSLVLTPFHVDVSKECKYWPLASRKAVVPILTVSSPYLWREMTSGGGGDGGNGLSASEAGGGSIAAVAAIAGAGAAPVESREQQYGEQQWQQPKRRKVTQGGREGAADDDNDDEEEHIVKGEGKPESAADGKRIKPFWSTNEVST
eukprot:g3802.t1